MKKLLLVLLVFSSLFSCRTTKPAGSDMDFQDDLSVWRPKPATVSEDFPALRPDMPGIPEQTSLTLEGHQNQEINRLLAQMSQKNLEITTIPGYKVLVHSGPNRSRAAEIMADLLSKITEPVRIVYEQPNYKVKVGAYLSKQEAHAVYVMLREYYPECLVIRDNIRFETSRYTE